MLAAMEKAVENDPSSPDVVDRYAMALFEAGRVEEAEKWFAKAVELAPNNTDARSMYGLTLWQLGKTDAAVVQLETTLKLDPATFRPARACARQPANGQSRQGRATHQENRKRRTQLPSTGRLEETSRSRPRREVIRARDHPHSRIFHAGVRRADARQDYRADVLAGQIQEQTPEVARNWDEEE
jgi:Tfp pilus assembly protein PilF